MKWSTHSPKGEQTLEEGAVNLRDKDEDSVEKQSEPNGPFAGTSKGFLEGRLHLALLIVLLTIGFVVLLRMSYFAIAQEPPRDTSDRIFIHTQLPDRFSTRKLEKWRKNWSNLLCEKEGPLVEEALASSFNEGFEKTNTHRYWNNRARIAMLRFELEGTEALKMLCEILEARGEPIPEQIEGVAAAMRRKRSAWSLLDDSTLDSNQIASKGQDPEEEPSSRLLASMDNFFDRMEILSSHIDRLHERYVRLNELNDDYVSREFSVETGLREEKL